MKNSIDSKRSVHDFACTQTHANALFGALLRRVGAFNPSEIDSSSKGVN